LVPLDNLWLDLDNRHVLKSVRAQRLGERKSDSESADQQAWPISSAAQRQAREQAFRLAVARIHQEYAVADYLVMIPNGPKRQFSLTPWGSFDDP